MKEPVPGIVVNETTEPHEAIAGSVTQATGTPTTKKDVLPDPLHVFEGITSVGGEVINSVGYDSDKLFYGEGLKSGERTVGAKNWLGSLRERAARRIKRFPVDKQKPV